MSTKANLTLDQGSTFSTTLNLTDDDGDPMSLTGFTATAAMKRWYTSNTATVFNTSINTVAGSITLELDANTTSLLWPGRYVYDVDITDGVSISRIVEGIITVTPAVTANTVG
jgi:hypothetical protein